MRKINRDITIPILFTAILILLVINFGFLILINKKTNCDQPWFYEVHIVYEEGKNYSEKARVLDYNTNNGTGILFASVLDVIYVKFYNLSINETYILNKGCCFNHQFLFTTDIQIVISVVFVNS